MDETPSPATPEPGGAACGWFGKIACLGDFASRRLPPECAQAWDDWLSAGVARSREQLGAGWLEAYLSAPVWRWLQAPDTEAGTWWSGVWMPSVDQVGRYFPLVLLRAEPGPPMSVAHWQQLEQDLEQMAQCALRSLAPDASLTGFDAQVQGLPGPRTDAPDDANRGGLLSWVISHQAQALQGHSLWWACGPELPVAADLCPRWPLADDFKRLLALQR